MSWKPRYPIYIPSKGRYTERAALTARHLLADDVPFRVVVEPQEAEQYEALVGADRLLVLPFHDLGQGSIPARNWIKQHATSEGHARHWQLDDNIYGFRMLWHGKRIPADAGLSLVVCEDFTDRYTNVALSGLNYDFFVPDGISKWPPVYRNVRVYSCTLVNNAIPHQCRGRYNEDADIALQVLGDGWCTLLINQFLAKKATTMKMKGGNTDELYAGDGRLTMARSLERQWPGVVEVDRRFSRPQHVVPGWRDAKFDTELIEKTDDDPTKPLRRDYGIRVVEQREVKSPRLQKLLAEQDSA
jgi:hypothetical protein